MFLWLVWLLYPPAGMKCSTVAESLKKTHFIVPSTARPWLHSLRWRWGSGQATSWLAARPPNGRGGPRCGSLKASSRLQQSNTSKRKMGSKWPYEFLIFHEWMSLHVTFYIFTHSSLLALSYTHWLSTNTKKIKGR